MKKKTTLKEITDCIEQTQQNKLESHFKNEKRAFNCENCDIHYVPVVEQWIFWNLCDKCFIRFDNQKMAARLSRYFGDGSIEGTESIEEWLKAQ